MLPLCRPCSFHALLVPSMHSLLPPCLPCSLRLPLILSMPSLFPPCPPWSLHALLGPSMPPCHVCARPSISLMLSAGKVKNWLLSGLHVYLKELLNPNKPGKVPAGSVCSFPPLLPPGCVSSVPVAGRLQRECHIQLPAAFPSQLHLGPRPLGTSSPWNSRTGFIGSDLCRVAMHGTLPWSRKLPGRAGVSCLWDPIPCLVSTHMEMLMELQDSDVFMALL